MKEHASSLIVEFKKNKRSKIIWVTFIAISLAPIFGGVFMFLMKDNGYAGLSGAFKSKAVLMNFTADWNSYLGLLSQAIGVGGILIFGFAAGWLFGREYSEGTAKDLLALPVSRAKIINAKFIYYTCWCLALVIFNLLLGLLIGLILGLPGWSAGMFLMNMRIYFVTTLLIIILNTPVALFAVAGRGYLVPLGLVALTLVIAQIIGALGLGNYFPWAVPGIYSGSGGGDLKSQLNMMSYVILVSTGILGYIGTILWWKYSDQTK